MEFLLRGDKPKEELKYDFPYCEMKSRKSFSGFDFANAGEYSLVKGDELYLIKLDKVDVVDKETGELNKVTRFALTTCKEISPMTNATGKYLFNYTTKSINSTPFVRAISKELGREVPIDFRVVDISEKMNGLLGDMKGGEYNDKFLLLLLINEELYIEETEPLPVQEEFPGATIPEDLPPVLENQV